MTTESLYWHFIGSNKKLGYGDNRDVRVGKTHTVDGKPILCRHGLHASDCVMDAFKWAPGPILCKVRLGGEIVRGSNKAVATERTVVAMADVSDVLLGFARRCALDVINLWDAPEIVVRYLRTGDDLLAAEAADAAAARCAEAAARADAEAAAARYAAEAARAAARYAADAAARAAAGYAADAAAAATSNNEIRKTQERRLLEMLDNVDWEVAK